MKLPPFVRAWADTGFTDEDWTTLAALLSARPDAGTPVVGGNGLRKVRCAVPSRGIGARGGMRVGYFFHQATETIFLLGLLYKRRKEVWTARELGELSEDIQAIKDLYRRA